MKQLSDGSIVSSKSYYFLLDWNDYNDRVFIQEKFNKQRLIDLTKEEYLILWLNATIEEYNKMVN